MTKKVDFFKFSAILLASFAINIQAAKPIVKISASPANIVAGGSSILTWTSTGAISASINQGIRSVPVNGSKAVAPTKTTTYTIKVKNSSGIAMAKATVTVVLPPPTVSFSVAPDTIPPKGPATLSWITSGAKLVLIDNGIGIVALNGSKVVKPAITKIYTITVKGSGGTVMARATVTVVVPPPTVSFSAAPAIITPGLSSNLTWSVQNATSISIDNGIGTVSANSSRTIKPINTTIYTLTAIGTGGTTTSQTTITVAQPPAVIFSTAPMSIKSGETATLTWTSTDATSASIDNAIGAVSVNGSIQVSPAQNTNYIITVSGPGGTATAQTAIYISNGRICYAYVANSSGNNVAVIDTASNTIIKTIPAREGPMGVAISQDGTRVFISSIYGAQRYIQTLETAANAVIYENYTPYVNCGAKFLAVDATHTSKYLYAASLRSFWDSGNYIYASALFVYNLAQSGQIGQIKCLFIPGGNQGGMALHPDGTLLYLSKPGENEILCLDTTKLHRPKPDGATYEYLSDEAIVTIPVNNPNSLVTSPDGNQLYAVGEDGIVVLDTNSNTILNTIAHSGYCYSLAIHPDGSWLYVASANRVEAIDTVTNVITKTLTIDGYDSSMNVHPDGSRLYITSSSNDNVSVVDTANLTLIATIPFPGDPYAYGNFVGYISESIAGKVSQDGVGVADVKVTVTSTAGSAVAFTDAAGNYITAVAKGTYSLTPTKTGYTFVPEQREVTIGEHSVAQIDFIAQSLPPVITAAVNPDRIDPQAGGSALLSWDVKYADSLTLDGEAVSMQGSRNVSPSVTTTYYFIATNAGGTVTKDILLYSGNLPTIQANANPVGILIGKTSTITWSSTKADNVSIDQGIGGVAISGSMQVSPTVTTTYTLKATGYGQNVTTMVTIIVGTLPAITATANPAVITIGASTTLNWTTTNATSVLLFSPGIFYPSNLPVNGSRLVYPTYSGTYNFEAANQIGTIYAHVWVTVSSLPIPTVTIAATPATIQAGGSSTLTWTSANATSATINNVIGAVPVNGSITVTPAATTTYKITVTGPEVSTSASATVTVSGPPPIVVITATPDTIPSGGSSTLTWTTTNATSVAIDQGIGNVQLNGSLEVKPALETIYTITATNSGGTAMASVTVKMLDLLLRSIWNRMKTALAEQNIEEAVDNFLSDTQNDYRDIFNALASTLPQIVSEMQEIEPVYFEENGAQCRIKRREEIEGTEYNITYYIYFMKDENGNWKIFRF